MLAEKVFARLTPERGVLRFNIGVLDGPELFQPHRPDAGPRRVPEGFFLRSERHTVLSVADLDADQRRRTAGLIRSLGPQLLGYRGLVDDRDRLLAWLDSADPEPTSP